MQCSSGCHNKLKSVDTCLAHTAYLYLEGEIWMFRQAGGTRMCMEFYEALQNPGPGGNATDL